MDRKKEIKMAYKNKPAVAGVFQVKNKINGKVLLGSSLNLDGALNRHKFELMAGGHRLAELQKDWKTFGADSFIFEILEVVPQNKDPEYNYEDDLTLLEEIWIEKLQPFGEKGYNVGVKIRQS